MTDSPDKNKSEAKPTAPVVDLPKEDRSLSVSAKLAPICIMVGLLLVAAAVGLYLWVNDGRLMTPSNLMLCVGLALVLWAFGSQAKVANPGYVLTGSAAIAAIFFAMLQHYIKPPEAPKRADIKGFIAGDFDPLTETIDIQAGEDRAYGRWDTKFAKHGFIFSQKNPESITCYQIAITKRSTDSSSGDPREHIVQIDVDARPLHQALKEKLEIRLYYHGRDSTSEGYVYPDRNANSSPFPPCDVGRLAPGESEGSGGAFLTLPITAAHAQENPTPQIELLESDDTDIRREAREALALAGTPAIRPMLEALEKSPDNYRIQLGVTAALLRMLELRKIAPKDIASQFTEADIAAVTRLITSSDKTLRINATPALIGLADPRMVPQLLAILEKDANDQGRYNAAIILRDTFQAFKPDTNLTAKTLTEIERISPTLGERTRAVLTDILINGGISPTLNDGWVFTGVLEKEPWNDSIFRFVDKPKERPEPGDVMIATDQVYLRKGPRVFDKEFGYVNQEAIGIVNAGVQFKVEEITANPAGYLWLRGSILK